TAQAVSAYETIVRSASASNMQRWLPGAGAELAARQLPGPSELSHPPLYYVVAAGLTAPFENADVFARLAMLRAFGVMLTGWAVWLCGAAGRMLWPARRRLAEAPLALAAGVPTVAAFAGAVNNDAMANLFGALLLVLVVGAATGWARRRPWLWSCGLAAVLVLGLLTKRTLLPLVLAVPVALLLRHVLQLRRMLALAIAGQLVLAVVALGLPAQRLGFWDPNGETRDYRCPGGVVGQWAMCIAPSATDGVRQYTSLAAFNDLAGHPATIGLWVRGRPDDRLRVVLGEGAAAEQRFVPVETAWRFHRVEFVPSRGAKQLPIGFGGSSTGRLEIDGIVLAPGRYSQTPPVYGDDGGQVVWDGRVVRNRLVNGSGEDAVRSVPRWVPAPVRRAFNGGLDQTTRFVRLRSDTARSIGTVWHRSVETFGMFWATVGWQVPPLLLPVGLLVLLALLVAGGWVGAVAQVVRPGATFSLGGRRGLGALTVCFVIACISVIGRGLPPDRVLVVSGRYLFPTLVAAAVVLTAGWRRLWRWDDRSFRNAVRWLALGTHTVFIVLLFFPFLAR
ncbi:MAG: Dolichyl-phosphate-mannose-protein mannosyltransferase, partial [Actinomycetota bacterium]|nr:Dolichyl-phosphate-mannose-protein mannosyltransferase [Actinomycetota bacterium]